MRTLSETKLPKALENHNDKNRDWFLICTLSVEKAVQVF